MAAPRDSDLPVFTYHRHSIRYTGAAPALAGTAIGFDGAIVSSGAVLGVLDFDAVPGQDVTITVAGICQMVSGSAIPIGSPVTMNLGGQPSPGSPGQQLFGRALSAATGPNQKIQILITREGTN